MAIQVHTSFGGHYAKPETVTLISCLYCEFETSIFSFLTKKPQKKSNTISVDMIYFKPWSVLGQQTKSAVLWYSRRFYFHLSNKLCLLSAARECSFLVANVSFLPSTVLCCILPPSLSARCSNVYLDHLLLTLLIENSSLLCALWPFVSFTLASFYKGRMLGKQLRR